MSVDGTWNTTVNSPMGVQKGVLSVKSDGASFSGTMQSPQGSNDISGKVDGNTLTWSSQLTQPFPITLEFTVTVDGDKMSGSVKAGAFGSSPLSGERA
ncbi:hypothetical protein ACO2Q3_13950 [Caulobacter sp. KR2-114]|uniref:hypothetical protein n=1 Tax=Caulobacter sp. KR2-114 TaxID=3400912 RepID=UPI003C0A121C